MKYVSIQGVPKRSGHLNILENINLTEKCFRQKLQGSKDLFTDLISLTLNGVVKVRTRLGYQFFLNGTFYF